MPTLEKKIREFWERSGVKDPVLKDAIRAGMVYLAEEIIDAVESQQKEMHSRYENLVTKEDMKLVVEMMEKRFEAQQKETNALRQEMNARFEALNQRFESLEKRLGFMQWLIGSGVLLIALKLFFPHLFPN